MARRLAESKATYLQGRAVTGHRSDAMFAHYAAAANREEMADEALDAMAKRFGLANDDGNAPVATDGNGAKNG